MSDSFYEFPPSSDIIKQGDIFTNIPCVQLDLDNLSILKQGDKTDNITWEEIIGNNKEGVAAVLGINPVPAIVISQTCDIQRKNYITFCEILELSLIKAFRGYKELTLDKLAKALIKNQRDMPEIFYLPPDDNLGFSSKMVAVFSNTIRLYKEDLNKFITYRKGRLNKVAYEHFREKLSHFFHRYAWEEWYILNKEEISKHKTYSFLPKEKLYSYQK